MNSTRSQSQLCAATPILSFVQCRISFRLLPSSVATFVLIEILLRNFIFIYKICPKLCQSNCIIFLKNVLRCLVEALVSHCHHTKKHAPCDALSRNHEPSYVNAMNLSYCKTSHLLNLQGKLNFYFISF